MTIFDTQDELNLLKQSGDYDSFAVFYQSQSNLKNKHCVIVKSETEFNELKAFYRDYDYKFTKLAL